jgi:predicted  nucleic acid-binding Zn-ribbon protein
MTERECLACGAVSADERDTCAQCGGRHFAQYVRDGVVAGNRVVGVVEERRVELISPAEQTGDCPAELLGAAMGHELLSTRDRVHVCA